MRISIDTIVKADLETVWAAWTNPDDINQWNAASEDWHNPRSSNDLREGGRFSYRMEARDGSVGFDFEGTYTTVVETRLIEFVMADDRSVSVSFTPEDTGTRVVEVSTDTRPGDPTLRCQTRKSSQTLSRTHSPISIIRLVSSAIGMKSDGRIKPRSGNSQRTSASAPNTSPVSMLYLGW